MAPSAVQDLPVQTRISETKAAGESQEKKAVVHGAEDKTPLEAISHGGLVIGGIRLLSSFELRLISCIQRCVRGARTIS